MPPLVGFSDNLFKDRNDVQKAALALIDALAKHQSKGGSRIRIPVSTGTHFDETAAQLEGFARPLWAIGALLAGTATDDRPLRNITDPFVRGLANGTNPDHSEYWGPITVCDQRMVEMEIVSFALLAAPKAFYDNQTETAKANIRDWLMAINGKPMPPTNWLWFRVMTNLALIKVCGLPREQLFPWIDDDLNHLETFYLTDGWASDGYWSDNGRQADYYSGSFAIQFSQLMYVKFAADIDPDRCEEYRRRACQFSRTFYRYFNANGAAIPFGRSLTYRFAFAGFWSAAAFAEVELDETVRRPGIIKGLVLRHLRWWSSKHDIFNPDGTLNIGFNYPNMYMCEDYNSPQSVYWCMKSFCCLGLSNDSIFWTTEESAYPSSDMLLSIAIKAPMHIISDNGNHHFMLSSGQFCPWPLKATEAKYGKFAYSSHFGFSVPTGPLLPQTAPDSMLAVSAYQGDPWRVRWMPTRPKFSKATVLGNGTTETVAALVSSWRPWQILDVNICTALIPPSCLWPDWHIRVHKISIGGNSHVSLNISAVEGGFAISGRRALDGLPAISKTTASYKAEEQSQTPLEATFTDSEGCLVCSADGASGIRKLRPNFNKSTHEPQLCDSEGNLLKPDSNTNLMRQRTVIPTLKSTIPYGARGGVSTVYYMVSAVFAMAQQTGDVVQRWSNFPTLHLGGEAIDDGTPHIHFEDW